MAINYFQLPKGNLVQKLISKLRVCPKLPGQIDFWWISFGVTVATTDMFEKLLPFYP